jgi:hypothetical protein
MAAIVSLVLFGMLADMSRLVEPGGLASVKRWRDEGETGPCQTNLARTLSLRLTEHHGFRPSKSWPTTLN